MNTLEYSKREIRNIIDHFSIIAEQNEMRIYYVYSYQQYKNYYTSNENDFCELQVI